MQENPNCLTDEQLTYKIRGCVFNVYNKLGPGLLESIYEQALMIELEKVGLNAKRQVAVPVEYEGQSLGMGFRVDILVEDKIIIELKAVKELEAVHFMQLQTYLNILNLSIGFLINFNTAHIDKDMVRVNRH